MVVLNGEEGLECEVHVDGIHLEHVSKWMDRIPHARIKELCEMRKGLGERIDEGVLRWCGHVERMESDSIAKRVYVGECAGSRSEGRPRKRWIDTVKECLRKSVLDVRQARRMVQDRSEWRGIVRGNADLDEMPQLYETFVGWKSVLWLSLQLKEHKGEIFCFSSIS